MRVTEQLVFGTAAALAAQARERLAKAAAEVSTGRRVVHPGDDPGAAGQLVSHRLERTRLQAMGRAVEAASDELGAADDALGGVGDALSRARELALAMANGTVSASERASAAVEADVLRQQAIASLNARFGNRYVFGGTRDSTPPFDATGTYRGAADARTVEIAPGVFEEVSVRADLALAGPTPAEGVPGVLERLSAALRSGEADAVRATLDGLDAAASRALDARVRAGATRAALDTAAAAHRSVAEAQAVAAARLSEVDVFDASSRLALAQQALQAVVAAAQQTFRLTGLGPVS